MKRKSLGPIFSVLFGMCVVAGRPAFAGEVVLANDNLSVAFDSNSGALTRLEDKSAHWLIERRPELGVSFRLFAPLPERRWNPVLGQKQHAAEVKKISDHEIRLRWQNLVSENGGVLPMTLAAVVTLTNSSLTFNAVLKNDSALTIETIDFPYFGDLNPPTRSTPLEIRVMRNNQINNIRSDEIYPHFHNEKGYWGVFYPLKTREAQQSPFCLIQSPDEGLYVGIDDAKVPYQLQYTFELHPGVVSSVNDLVPQEDEIAGTPVHLEFRTCHFVFAHAHTTTTLAPVTVRYYRGDWHQGVALYKQWRSSLDSESSK